MLFVFALTLFVMGIVGSIVYLIHLPIKKRLIKKGTLTMQTNRQINTAYVWTIVVASAYLTIDAYFPGNSFYEQEFKTVTLRDLPSSAKFIEKNASYPDFHGDYCSSSQIELSRNDYKNLLLELNMDKQIIKNGSPIGSSEFSNTLGDKKATKIMYGFTRQIEGQIDHHHYIGFYNDGQTIFVNVCVT